MRLDTISDQLIEKIDSILKNNKGNMQLKIQVIDLKQEQQLALASTKKVTISSELLIKLEELGLNYKLN